MDTGDSLVGLAACACWAAHCRIEVKRSGILMVLLTIFVLCGLFAPYLISIVRNLMPPFLPFISQSGGLPPSNGVFAFFMVTAAFFGVIFFTLFYETVNHRNTKDLKIVRICNNISLGFILISVLGLVITVCNPVGYTDVPNKYEWVTTVLFEHGIGAVMVLAGGALFQYLLVVIWWFLPDTSRREKYIKIFFAVVYFLFFLLSLYPMPAFLLEEMGSNPFDIESMKKITYSLPIVYSAFYIICSICEWALVLLSLVNFMTHFKDMQRVSFSIVLRHKSCLAEDDEPVPSISLKVLK